ncbi:hypothetical protein PG996_003150 [Apiospora saccharicola]|uniref:Uncharacterized protein n=1 Tax=Apiospora saccharicola TaxID=335842 RepID=A0ABR1W0H8_9PEZI
MGAYVSVHECQSRYNVTINCDQTFDNETNTYKSLGGIERGQFPGDPDIAGIGIIGVFLGATCFALFISAIDVIWQALKTYAPRFGPRLIIVLSPQPRERLKKPDRISLTDILESILLPCSDQQIFTGAAYAMTLRYYQGCTISAYHYNIVANMLLISCATHLMSVTIVRHYWRYPLVAMLRVVCITGVFIATGLLMVNQNADEMTDLHFPTEIPAANTTTNTFHNTTSNADAFFHKTLQQSAPGNKIHGWNWFIVLLLFYIAAGLAEVIRFFRRNRHRADWRGKAGKRLSLVFKPKSVLRRWVSFGYLLYLGAGIGISSAAVVLSASYIFGLRTWVARSGWMEMKNDLSPEDDWISFGQAVPIFTSALVLFTALQVISEKAAQKKRDRHADEERPAQDGTTIFYNDPKQNYSLLDNNNVPGDHKADTAYYGANQVASPPAGRASGRSSQVSPFHVSPHSDSNTSTPRPSNVFRSSGGPTPQPPGPGLGLGLGLHNTSPLLGNNSSSSIVLKPPPQSVVVAMPANAAATATPPRGPLTSRFSSGSSRYSSSNPPPVSPPSPTPATTSRPPSGTDAPLSQQDDGAGGSPGQSRQQGRGVSGASWSALPEARRTSNGSWMSSRGG